MAKFIIEGKHKLSGTIRVSGAKNAALKVLPASLMLDGVTTLTNVPQIEDVRRMIELMQDLGATITEEGNIVTIDPSTVNKDELHPHLHQRLRASILLAGPMLHLSGKITFPEPGGCVLGKRPIDFFLTGYEAFGVRIENRPDGYTLYAENLHPAKIVFPRISHTATEAMMMFAARIPGQTTLINCAMEPEVVALADFLNSCGAHISGAGTSTIVIDGVQSLASGTFETIPDRIEAGTFAILAAAAGAHLTVTGIIPSHLEILWQLFRRANVQFNLGEDFVEILPSPDLQAISKDIVTHEYPGFPTDLQAPMTVLMTQAKGNSLVFETIYDGRLFYVDSLSAMGANILMCDPHRVLVSGPTELVGKKVVSPDIRAGIALVIAALIANGTSEIDNIYLINRGYENIKERLKGIGAHIEEVE
jgi:UDP-N-acetylglucosamine 1-carboxyvinyltransferase